MVNKDEYKNKIAF